MIRNKIKKQRQQGFTLVEVIVVAVIVAAMAAVAVPMYLTYVENSRQNAAANAAGSIASFIGACRSAGGTVAALDAAPETATSAAPLVCAGGTGDGTSISIPPDITITHGAGTSLTGVHADGGGASAPYSY